MQQLDLAYNITASFSKEVTRTADLIEPQNDNDGFTIISGSMLIERDEQDEDTDFPHQRYGIGPLVPSTPTHTVIWQIWVRQQSINFLDIYEIDADGNRPSDKAQPSEFPAGTMWEPYITNDSEPDTLPRWGIKFGGFKDTRFVPSSTMQIAQYEADSRNKYGVRPPSITDSETALINSEPQDVGRRAKKQMSISFGPDDGATDTPSSY